MEHSLRQYQKVIDQTIFEIATDASQNAKAAISITFDHPTPWMEWAFDYTSTRLNRYGSSALMFVLLTQSIFLRDNKGPTRTLSAPATSVSPTSTS